MEFLKNKNFIGTILGILFFLVIFYFSQKETPITNFPSSGTEIVAFGDSLIEGVGATSGNDLVSILSKKINRPIVNLGKSGDTTLDGVNRLSELDIYNPKVVIVLLGGNDYLKKVPLAETFKNLEFIIKNIERRGAVVLLLGIQGGIFSDNFDEKFRNLRNTYNTAFVSNVLGGLIGNTKYMSDAVHPNDLGYIKLAERIYPVLSEIIK